MLMGRHEAHVGGISTEGITQVRSRTIGAPAVLLKTNTEGDMIRGDGNLNGLIFAVFCRCVLYGQFSSGGERKQANCTFEN